MIDSSFRNQAGHDELAKPRMKTCPTGIGAKSQRQRRGIPQPTGEALGVQEATTLSDGVKPCKGETRLSVIFANGGDSGSTMSGGHGSQDCILGSGVTHR